MSKGKEFYIGWQDNMPPDNRAFLKKVIIGLFISIPILAFLFVYFQKPFSEGQFEFGNIKTYTGIYHSTPTPMLYIDRDSFRRRYVSCGISC